MKKILRFAFFVLLCCVLVHTPMLAKAACDHAYTETITKKPTCDNVGTATYVCEKCKDTYQNLLFPVHITINEHPQNVRAIKDATATVSVNAVGNEGKTLTYTWYRDQEDTEDDILVKSASNDPTFSVVMNEQWDGSTVYCVITDECGEASGVQTQSALLQMIPEPKITKQPVSTNALLGNEVQVEVEAVGEGLTYQWYYANKGEDSFTKSNITDAVYSVIMSKDNDGCRLYCEITDAANQKVKTDIVEIGIPQLPTVNTLPATIQAYKGQKITVNVSAEGEGLNYRWYYIENGTTVEKPSSANTNTYITTVSEVNDGRRVYCQITDQYGQVVKTNIMTILMKLPEISKQPTATEVLKGEKLQISVAAIGEGLSYRWYYIDNGSTVAKPSSANTNTYITTVSEVNDGRRVYCEVTDKYGNVVKSETVTILMVRPRITVQPTSKETPRGQKIQITVKATGEGLSYRWYYIENGTTVAKPSSANTNTYITTVSEVNDGRRVYCEITDKYGYVVRSDTVTVLLSRPRITAQPKPAKALSGQKVQITVKATGEGLSYRWYYIENGTTVAKPSSANTNTYITTVSEVTDGRRVYCEITDKYGNKAKTDIVSITMNRPRITAQPTSVKALEGQKVRVVVTATGDGLSYRWYYIERGTTVAKPSSANTSTYMTTVGEATDGRQVYCVITDKYGQSVQSKTVTVSMIRPIITKQPTAPQVHKGEKLKISVTATGEGLSYRWYYIENGTTAAKPSSANTNTYITTVSEVNDGRRVYCEVTDKYGNVVKSNTVTILMIRPRITVQPTSVKALSGQKIQISVTATGEGLSYRWYYIEKGTTVAKQSSANTNKYISTMSSVNNGRKVYCVITDKYGNKVQTNTVTLEIPVKPTITTQPTSVKALNGQKIQISVKATGEGLSYRWYYIEKGTTVAKPSSANTNTYISTMGSVNNGRKVYCVITDKYGQSVTSNTVNMSIPAKPVASGLPESAYASIGLPVKVSVSATGEGLKYQWYRADEGETSFSKTNQTTSTYNAIMDRSQDGCQIYCLITDKYGQSVQTDTVTVYLVEKPVIINQPTSMVAYEGMMVSVPITANGEGLTYKWYYADKGSNTYKVATGFTGDTYTVEMTGAKDGMKIYCVITDKYGQTVTSSVITMYIQ